MPQVYDVTDFISQHPGGKVILTYAGRDATDVFSTFHAATTWRLLRPMFIGELEVSSSPAARSTAQRLHCSAPPERETYV